MLTHGSHTSYIAPAIIDIATKCRWGYDWLEQLIVFSFLTNLQVILELSQLAQLLWLPWWIISWQILPCPDLESERESIQCGEREYLEKGKQRQHLGENREIHFLLKASWVIIGFAMLFRDHYNCIEVSPAHICVQRWFLQILYRFILYEIHDTNETGNMVNYHSKHCEIYAA